MKAAIALIYTIALLQLSERSMAGDAGTLVPESCPVTRSTPETRFTPPSSPQSLDAGTEMFWYGSDLLYTSLHADGRWYGIKSPTGTRNKSFWFRKNAEWLTEEPYQLKVTYRQLTEAGPMFTATGVTNAVLRGQVAMLLVIELPNRGCWEVTATYKNAHVSFVTWVD